MAEERMVEVQLPRAKLGSQGLEVSKLGFGCRGLSGGNNNPVPEDVGIAIIKHAFSKGITFFDTADSYGAHANEGLIGKALKELPREKIQLATKFGLAGFDPATGLIVNGTPKYVCCCCEASLKHLDVEYIDLYYQHRVDKSVPMEETMGELKKLVEEGKIKYIGLSEASPDPIRRAHAVHPVTALQMEWSVWTRDIEEEIVPLCRELGIGIVPYSPLGRGFFGDKAVDENVPANSFLRSIPRFQGENFGKNKIIYTKMEMLAEKHRCTPAQLALAWVLRQGDDVAPIPGESPSSSSSTWHPKKHTGHPFLSSQNHSIKNLDDNIGSLRLNLTKQDLEEISDAVPLTEVAGARAPDVLISTLWRFANTPARV